MLSRNLERSLHQALALAKERSHEFATLEHLLLSLTDDTDCIAVLKACGVGIGKLKEQLSDYLDNELSNMVINRNEDPKPTSSFQRVIQRAAIHVQTSGRQEVTGANVLVAMFSERESHAVFFLQEQDMSRFDAVNYISHGIAKVPGGSQERMPHGTDEEAEQELENTKEKLEALKAYCVDLNQKARDDRTIDQIRGNPLL